MEEDEVAGHGGECADVKTAPDIESQIKEAMRVRVSHFKEQADSLTFEGVRRLIEKDLGLETRALDAHRRFIKQLLLECLEGGDNDHDNASKNSGETIHNSMSSNKEEVPELSEEPDSKTKAKENSAEDEKLEDSPGGLLSGQTALSSDITGTHDNGKKEGITQGVIKKAIMKRGAYFRANSEKITMSGVRRLLEEDLELNKHSLDSHKKFINEQMEVVLQSPQVSESASAVKKKPVKKSAKKDAERNSESLVSEEEDVEDEEKPRKKNAKGRMQKLEGVKKRKAPPAKEPKTTKKKRVKSEEEAVDVGSESDDGKHESADESPSSPERSKKKEVSTPVYGKQVDRLKSIIKSCGMSVPPAIYKKVKQVSESKREALLIKELEGILSKEGLSTNPSEKEIKEVKKKKERARELEGIDTSNIVSSSRRRTSSSMFVPPPKPKEPDEEENSDNEEGDEDDEDDEEDDEEEDDEDEEDDENDDGNEDGQSEELSEDQEDDD